MAADWFGYLGTETVRVDFAGVLVLAGENMAMLSAAATFTAFSADGRKLRDSRWLIVHEHSSLPVDIETGRGIFGA